MKKRIPFLLIALLLLSACTAGGGTPTQTPETPAVSPTASAAPDKAATVSSLPMTRKKSENSISPSEMPRMTVAED